MASLTRIIADAGVTVTIVVAASAFVAVNVIATVVVVTHAASIVIAVPAVTITGDSSSERSDMLREKADYPSLGFDGRK